jgi:hypothetical protein
MLTPQQIIDDEYLVSRCALLEIAAMLDHHDFTVEKGATPAESSEKLDCLRDAMSLIADPQPSTDRAERLLKLFATV